MPATFVVVGMVLYLLRRRRPVATLWAVVDRSIGMWIVRRLAGRPDPGAARLRSDGEAPTDALPAPDEIAYRIGVPGAIAPNRPDRLVASGDAQAGGARRVLWRDSAFALAAVSAVVLVAVVVLPRLPQGAVLTATDDGRFPAEVTLTPSPGSTDTAAATASPTAELRRPDRHAVNRRGGAIDARSPVAARGRAAHRRLRDPGSAGVARRGVGSLGRRRRLRRR